MNFNPLERFRKKLSYLNFFVFNSSFKQEYKRDFIDKTFFTNMQPLFINSKTNINDSLFNPCF